MNRIKQMILMPWDVMRIFRLGIGVWIIVVAIQSRDWMVGILGAFFLYQAVTNTGCCSSAGCYHPPTRTGKVNSAADEALNMKKLNEQQWKIKHSHP